MIPKKKRGRPSNEEKRLREAAAGECSVYPNHYENITKLGWVNHWATLTTRWGPA